MKKSTAPYKVNNVRLRYKYDSMNRYNIWSIEWHGFKKLDNNSL